jgi:hypothetical protein
MQNSAAAGAPVAKKKGSRKVVRTIHLFLLWLLFAAICVQVLLIGMGLFYQGKFAKAHAELGWTIAHMFAPLVFIVGFFGRLGWRLIVVNSIALVLILVLPILATMRDSPVGGLHPLTAVTVFVLTFYLMIKVRALVPAPIGSAALSAGSLLREGTAAAPRPSSGPQR